MDSETAEVKSDFFLHEVPNVKISRDRPEAPRPPLKVEMLSLRLTDAAEKLIMDTLNQIHGPDFKLSNASDYKDHKSNIGKGYWMDRGSLVVKGGSDNSQTNSEESTEDKFKMFALLRLESYGFHKTHCLEALNHCNEVDTALELLFAKYYNFIPRKDVQNDYTKEASLEDRNDEKNVLESIYESAYEEKIANQVWILTFNLDYLLNLYTNKPSEVKKPIVNSSKKPKCRNVLRGIPCKYGNKCRFSHEVEKEEKKPDTEYLHPSKFELEIRFPKDSQYPFEPPFIFLKTPAVLPPQVCLHICRRLFKEAQELAEQGIVSVYSLAELLQNEDEMVRYLKSHLEKFLSEDTSLFQQNSIVPVTSVPLPTHYRKGMTSRDNKMAVSPKEQLKEDRYLVQDMVKKVENPKYLNMLSRRKELPAWGLMKEILNTIRSSQVCVISGETGCGKSTQVPQFVLDDWLLNYSGDHVEVVCTQPRRISAIGVAERVADERLEKVGKTVGYQIRLESKVSSSTRLTFCTTGILLRRLECDPLLQSVSHIIIDESWNDHKSKAKAKAAAIARRQRGTGGGPPADIPSLTPWEEKVISFLSPVLILGHDVREAGVEETAAASPSVSISTGPESIDMDLLEAGPSTATIFVVEDQPLVHERSEESDFLLLVLKHLLPQRPDLKIILMSATLNAHIFCTYFGSAPVLEIPGRTFPVTQLFLEDVLERTQYVLEENSPYTRHLKRMDRLQDEMETCEIVAENSMPKDVVRDENCTLAQIFARYRDYSRMTCKNLYMLDPERINLELIEALLVWIVSGEHEFPREGSVLVFLPGLAEITSLHDQLAEHPEFSPRHGKYVLLPLHSALTSEEQAMIFKKPKNGARKIVLSTNIAETSITIDDCVFVVDGGRMKEKRFDAGRGMESLDLVWESRANAQQRRGRAGRVMPGVCFHLVTGHRFKHHMAAQPVPELQRVPLERLLLRIKILPNFSTRTLHSVLSDCIEPPTSEHIDSAIHRLQDVGALDSTQTLTPLGLHLAALPVDVRIGKLALFGAIFCCVDAALTIAACLSYKSPFVAPFGKKQQADNKRKQFAVANSDQLTILKAYNKWREAISRSRQAGYVFASENYLSSKTLDTLTDIKYQLLELLVSIGFVPVDLPAGARRRAGHDAVLQLTGPQLNLHGDNPRLLASLLCAALYPNVAKVLTPEKSFSISSSGAVPRQPKPEELRFKTKQDGYVALHPSSVNYSVGHFPSPYLVFQEKLKTSRVFIRDCSMVPCLPLVLFSGYTLDIQVHNGCTVVVLEDGWIMFQVDKHEVAEMLKIMRTELFQLLEEKIRDPLLNLLNHENGKKIISTIVHIVSNT